ncbi:MAG: kinase/pyrophosphorylase [Streptococcaceae bacterium]|jgi:regulator of PEP synthase PpsR (kinase-PPPase family)|nr:kinase/pyrophosphorylase [Streptococcaceae bacterium]
MANKPTIHLYVISDSVGDTAVKVAHANMAQFTTTNFVFHRKSFVRTLDGLKIQLAKALANNALVVHTLVEKRLQKYTNKFCANNGLFYQDLLMPVITEITKRTGIKPARKLGAQHQLNKNYFKRIKAIEFAVKYDDGKDPSGFFKAEIVILGISRTSKTPLSLFLANKNIKVANLPVMPQIQIPDELWKIDPKKIIGLTNNPKIISNIRMERMRSYGLEADTEYSNINNIKKELKYANYLYEKLGCKVINTSRFSIEETATIILDVLNLEDNSYNL